MIFGIPPPKEQRTDEEQALIDSFLSNGGKITQCSFTEDDTIKEAYKKLKTLSNKTLAKITGLQDKHFVNVKYGKVGISHETAKKIMEFEA